MNPKHAATWSLLRLAYDRGHRHLNQPGNGRHRAHD